MSTFPVEYKRWRFENYYIDLGITVWGHYCDDCGRFIRSESLNTYSDELPLPVYPERCAECGQKMRGTG